ncbi:hypothetical protein LCGC14_0561170 [marine sediment metagenome]|uniref:Uncharacterized protein n=1 Tax=marine sediment metagenome TaxID=412755 RepID=A0A0F9U8I5_9ZZZZ
MKIDWLEIDGDSGSQYLELAKIEALREIAEQLEKISRQGINVRVSQ